MVSVPDSYFGSVVPCISTIARHGTGGQFLSLYINENIRDGTSPTEEDWLEMHS